MYNTLLGPRINSENIVGPSIEIGHISIFLIEFHKLELEFNKSV